MVVTDTAAQNSSSVPGRIAQLMYGLWFGFIFVFVEVSIFALLPLIGLYSFGIISQAVYSGGVIAILFVSLTVVSDRAGIANEPVHTVSPWPEWRSVGRFAKNWFRAIRDDGIAQLAVFYGIGAAIGGSMSVLYNVTESYSVVVLAVGYIGIFGYAQLYHSERMDGLFWSRD